ncbi:MAG: hypothetical protein HQL14_07620 [Candidatus Omnitrophica bacterium]|nr:hypothetical protein [Candidatus Omnitrophota bacterium]
MKNNLRFLTGAFVIGIIIFGLWARFYHIGDNQFLFYDEGMYLGYNRMFLNLVANNPAHNLSELGIIVSLMMKMALSTAKALWFFILNLRVFFLGPQSWYVARWISAASGLTSVLLVYFWAKRYFHSHRIGILTAVILLILPSHIFYSRLGMQEALSSLLFLSAIYLYMSKNVIRWQFFVSVLLLACVFFTNYRMIIAPVFIGFIECYNFFVKARVNWPKLIIYIVIFYGIVLGVGSLYGGMNNHVTFAWMFHQAADAGGKFNVVNFLSYPYYVFVLEGFFFACFFWGNFYLLRRREYSKLLPFGIVFLQMLIFSFAAEKGARYLCVVLPFMAAAAAVVIDDLWQRSKSPQWRVGIVSLCVLGLGMMMEQSFLIAVASTDYEKAVHFVLDRDPTSMIVSTQPLVEGLYLDDDKKIVPCPQDLASLFKLYKQGAGYLILDPQVYISWTADGRRFSPPLNDYLEFIHKSVSPIQTFPHLNNIFLKRFVLDHNEQLLDSLAFLRLARTRQANQIKIYDLKDVFLTFKNLPVQ